MARTSATSFSPTRCAAPARASAARSSPRRSSRTPARRGAPIPASSRSSGRCRSSPRICPITTSCWSPTRARCSAPIVPFRTWMPRPVAGTAGLIPSGWHPASEQWGGTQIQNRFEKATGRRMLSKDMAAWTAVRIVGEAATRTHSADRQRSKPSSAADEFSIAAFKGQKLTFRNWNWQLRQPIFLGDGRSVVSTSPQEGFLHQFSELDTLGVDQPETKCASEVTRRTNAGGVSCKDDCPFWPPAAAAGAHGRPGRGLHGLCLQREGQHRHRRRLRRPWRSVKTDQGRPAAARHHHLA